MTELSGLEPLLHGQVETVLQRISDAVIVLDRERTLCFANDRARNLLGYEDGEALGGRCRQTTRGVDCETSCPLTYALETGSGPLHDFKTVYKTRDGRPVPLAVTLLPFYDDDGEFSGAVEILRPTQPAPGVLAAGQSEAAAELRRHLASAAAGSGPMLLVGELAAGTDVAAAIHRFSGLPEELFLHWSGSWEGVRPWPAGTMLAVGDQAVELLRSSAPAGWRLLAAVDAELAPDEADCPGLTVLRLPDVACLAADLPLIARAQLEVLQPALSVTPEAVQALAEIARRCGFQALKEAAVRAVSAAQGRLEACHVIADAGALLVDDVLRCDNPLMALEECLLREVLNRCEWRMQEAADRLGMSRVTLWRKLKDHGIERPCNGNGS